MPYTVQQEDGKFCVYLKGEDGEPTGKSLGCHDSQEEASAQIGAISSEEKEASPEDYLVVGDPKVPSTWHLPVKRGGKPDHTLMGAAWAALHEGYRGNKYEGPDKEQALAKLTALYKSEDMPVPIDNKEKEAYAPEEDSGDGYCVCMECGYRAPHTQGEPCVDRFCPKCSAKMTNEEVSEEVITEVVGSKKEARRLYNTIMTYVAKALGIRTDEPAVNVPDVTREPGFFVIKEGKAYRWVGVSSTNHQDRVKEIITAAALEADVEANPKDRGELIYWHLRQIPLGSCDFAVVSDGFLIESGLWYETPEAISFRKEVQKNPASWKMSIGFGTAVRAMSTNQVIQGKLIPAIHNLIVIEERSLLPADQAANPFTAFSVDKGESTMRQDKKNVLAGVIGQELADALEQRIDAAAAAAAKEGVVTKEVTPTIDVVATYLRENGQEAFATLLEALPKQEKTKEQVEAEVLTQVREFIDTLTESDVKAKMLKALTEEPEAPAKEETKEADLTEVVAQLRADIATLAKQVTVAPAKEEVQTTAALSRPTRSEKNVDETAQKVTQSKAAPGEAVVDDMTETMFTRIIGQGV